MEEKKDLVERYIEYVLKKIEELQRYTKELESGNLDMFQVKDILAKRTHIALTLIAEKERARIELKQVKKFYDIWWSDRFSLVRQELNPREISGSKYASKSDIEAEVITRYKQEFIEEKEKLDEVTSRFDFLRGVLEQWNGLQFDLANLVKTEDIELRASGDIRRTQDNQGFQTRQRIRG